MEGTNMMNGVQLKTLVEESLERTMRECEYEDLKIETTVGECEVRGTVGRVALNHQGYPAQGIEMDVSGDVQNMMVERFEFAPVVIEGTVDFVNNWVRELRA